MKQTTLRSLLSLAALAAAAPAAHAGNAIDHPVNISEFSQTASGSFNSVRHSSDSTQWLECSVKVKASEAAELTCKAVNKFERVLQCSTKDPALVTVGLGIGDYSWILFKCDGSDLVALNVTKASYSLP